jgi:hypothetical protein
MKSPLASPSVVVVVVAMSCLLGLGRVARGLDDSSTPASKKARALSNCEDARTSETFFAALIRRNALASADRRLNTAIVSSADKLETVEVAGADRQFRDAHMLLAIQAIGGIVLCVLFCRAPGVLKRERGFGAAVLLALIGYGLFEARSDHATRVAAARKTEGAENEVAKLAADRSRLQARWRYDRHLAVADIFLDQCQAAAGATADAGSE